MEIDAFADRMKKPGFGQVVQWIARRIVGASQVSHRCLTCLER